MVAHKVAVVSDGSQRWQLLLLCGVAAITPFNLGITSTAWTDLALRPMVIVALTAALAVVVAEVVGSRRVDRFDWLVFAWIGAVWLSAMLSENMAIGAGGAVRLSIAGLLVVAVRRVVQTRSDQLAVMRWLAAGFAAACASGLAIWLLDSDGSASSFFVGTVTSLGSIDRLTRPWAHANVAAMATVICLPACAVFSRRSLRSVALVAGTFVLVLTVSRGGLLGAGAAALVWVAVRRSARDLFVVSGLALLAGGVVVMSDGWQLRLDRLGDEALYDVAIEAPTALLLDGADGTNVAVAVANKSASPWSSQGDQAVLLSARWLGEDGRIWHEDTWPLPSDLAPATELTMTVELKPAVSGVFDVRWDLLQPDVAYFGQFLGHEAVVTKVQASVLPDQLFDSDWSEAYELVPRVINLSRRDLWPIARQDFASSPLLGVGPNQFGASKATELAAMNRRAGTHAHNLVAEPFATLGLAGAVPLLALWGFAVVRGLRVAWKEQSAVSASVAAGLVGITAHGFVDWPFVVITTIVPIALVIGLAIAPASGEQHE